MAREVDPQDEITAVWEGHEDEDYRQDQSHWRGAGRWNDEQWGRIGLATWLRVNDLYRTVGRSYPTVDLPTMLEWGPGGGANLFRFADHTSRMYGVDISQKNLDESARVLAEKDDVDFVPILLAGEPESVVASVTAPIDLFVSTAVFQHFPSQDYGVEVLRTMNQLMAPKGLAYIQIRFDNGNPKYAPKKLTSYRKSHITANSYELSQFWDILVETGFQPLKIANLSTVNNYAGFYFARP